MNKPHHHSKIQLGDRKGLLTILSYEGSKWNDTHTSAKSYWRCKCDCGNEITVPSSKLNPKKPQQIAISCGCISFAQVAINRTTHGMSTHPAYHAWRMARQRCTLPTSQAWNNYGGRGIQMCDRWKESFENFWEDMGPTYQPKLELDRRNNEGHYEPDNCRWITAKENGRNKRSNVNIETPNGTMNLSEAAEYSGINHTTLHYRLQHNWPAARMFDTPDFSNKVVTTK